VLVTGAVLQAPSSSAVAAAQTSSKPGTKRGRKDAHARAGSVMQEYGEA
jgi:hypothetical protein